MVLKANNNFTWFGDVLLQQYKHQCIRIPQHLCRVPEGHLIKILLENQHLRYFALTRAIQYPNRKDQQIS